MDAAKPPWWLREKTMKRFLLIAVGLILGLPVHG
jgi:hypothetical protein